VCPAFGNLSHQLQGVALFGGESRTSGWFNFFSLFFSKLHTQKYSLCTSWFSGGEKRKKKPCLTSHADIISNYSHLFSLSTILKNRNFRICIAISKANPTSLGPWNKSCGWNTGTKMQRLLRSHHVGHVLRGQFPLPVWMPRVAEFWLDRVCFAVAVIIKFRAVDAENLVIIFWWGAAQQVGPKTQPRSQRSEYQVRWDESFLWPSVALLLGNSSHCWGRPAARQAGPNRVRKCLRVQYVSY
jgi:hypothetical protein